MLVATNSGRTRVWKFNPYHDSSSGQFSSGGGGSGKGNWEHTPILNAKGVKAFHDSALPTSVPSGVSKTDAFRHPRGITKDGRLGPSQTTVWKGPKGRVQLDTTLNEHKVTISTNTRFAPTVTYHTHTVGEGSISTVAVSVSARNAVTTGFKRVT